MNFIEEMAAKRNGVDVEGAAEMLGTDVAGVVNLVEMERLEPMSTKPMIFDKAEVIRCKSELEAQHRAFLAFLKAGEDMDFREGED